MPFREYSLAKGVAEKRLNRFSGIDKVGHASVMSACLDHLLKEAAGAPTRGGFMMASDIPAWQQPDLRQSPTKRKFGGGIPPQESPSLPANDRYAGDGTSADSNEFHPPKTAATLEALQQAYRRIAPVRASSALGPVTNQTRAQLRGAVKNIPEELIRRGYSKLPELRPSAERALQQHYAGLLAETASTAGKIVMPPGGFSGYMGSVPKGAQRAANIIAGLHEGFERQVPPKYVRDFRSHGSPDVIHKEHNLLASLSGPGSAEGRRYFQNIRKYEEGRDLTGKLLDRYGEKAAPWATYGEGLKLTKAMRKDLMRDWMTSPTHKFGSVGKRHKLEGDALIEVDEHGKSLGKDPAKLDGEGRVKEKDSQFFTWSPGDFHTVNPNAKSAPKIGSALEMPTEKMAEFVRELLKEAAGLPRAADLLRSGAPKVPHVGLKPPTSIPKSVPGLSKPQPIQMGHPTPSIAKQVKPIGPGMGNPAAGCVASGAQGSLGAYKQQNRFTQGRMQV